MFDVFCSCCSTFHSLFLVFHGSPHLAAFLLIISIISVTINLPRYYNRERDKAAIMNNRTKFVVFWMALLFVVSWTMSLGRLIGIHFWDRMHVLQEMAAEQTGDGDSSSTPIENIGSSYYTERRYIYFLPHVFGAVLWWNLYFLQLIPSIRHKYKWFHRNLGRLLMFTVLAQVLSGLGLASTTHSPIIKLVSFFMSIAVMYCLARALYYAIHRDIPKHKFWVLRLVGYNHTIVLQRFWLLVLIVAKQCGWYSFLETPASLMMIPSGQQQQQQQDDDPSAVVVDITYEMFDQSFVIAIITAFLVTEWYLSAELLGMEDSPVRRTTPPPSSSAKQQQQGVKEETNEIVDPEQRPLIAA